MVVTPPLRKRKLLAINALPLPTSKESIPANLAQKQVLVKERQEYNQDLIVGRKYVGPRVTVEPNSNFEFVPAGPLDNVDDTRQASSVESHNCCFCILIGG
jgi:hypothetical protein